MLRTRIIPVLLMKNRGLYKGRHFKNHRYVGDPINTVRIFNDKQVDELVLLDIEATVKNQPIDYDYLRQVVSEAFMPIAYGGGIKSVEQAKMILGLGVEKIILCTAGIENPDLVSQLVKIFGSQSVIFSCDIGQSLFKQRLYSHSGRKKCSSRPLDIILEMQERGVGEILYNSVLLDGSGKGYDKAAYDLSAKLNIPLILCGGARDLSDMVEARNAGVDACAASSFFIYHGPHRAVLISYPDSHDINQRFGYEELGLTE